MTKFSKKKTKLLRSLGIYTSFKGSPLRATTYELFLSKKNFLRSKSNFLTSLTELQAKHR